jgi:hypothetical protein
MPPKLERIQDDILRQSMAEARAALRSGDFKKVVELSSTAYLEVLRNNPELLQQPQQIRTLLFFPRLGARLVVGGDGTPEVVYDRETFIMSEAVTYFEYAVDNLVKAGL